MTYKDQHEPYIEGFCFVMDGLTTNLEKRTELNPYNLHPVQLANALSSRETLLRIELTDAILGGIGCL